MKLEFSGQVSENTHIKFHENPFGGRGVVPCTDGRTVRQRDM